MSDNSQIPVVIKLQVGEVQIPVAQLLEMGEGTVLDPNNTASFFPKVRALVGDRYVAEGELVAIDGKVGFRVTRLI